MKLIATYFLITSIFCYGEGDSWIQHAADRSDPEAIEWVKQHLLENPPKQHLPSVKEIKIAKNECINCSSDLSEIFTDPQMFVFMSFSIPDETWVSISRELEKVGGVFVIRGLPQNNFKELASKILSLKEKGVDVPIQLDPKKFQVYQLTSVPAFLVIEEKSYDKVVGNVSVKFALELMATKGDTLSAKLLYRSYGLKS